MSDELIGHNRTKISKRSIPDLACSLWYAIYFRPLYEEHCPDVPIVGEFGSEYKWMPGITFNASDSPS